MQKNALPLKEVSIDELFVSGSQSVYEIPIYQRNYAWEKDEIAALVQDVYDAFKKNPSKPYYIGTLVSYHKGDGVFEIIDGQQRLTTLRLLLSALGIPISHRLTYRARKRSDDTLNDIPNFNTDERDSGIENGYKYAKTAINDLVSKDEEAGFISYFRNSVHIIHYRVPKDIDLNHYFEIMNSRGEQLEKHEIVKASLMEKLESGDERHVFNLIWECCSEMGAYAQQSLMDIPADKIFIDTTKNVSSNSPTIFLPISFSDILDTYRKHKKDANTGHGVLSLQEIIQYGDDAGIARLSNEGEIKDSFLPIIDFSNFLLIVLKITRMDEVDFSPLDFNLDDKELLNEFVKAKMDADKVRKFAYNLLKTKFLLDNYVVHHSKEEDTIDSNPWKLQQWHKDEETKKGQLKNLFDDNSLQDKMVHLLSMFEVSFASRQRKNYLFYCLLYLIKSEIDLTAYAEFTESLAKRFFNEVYLDGSKLNAINTPLPGSFDSVILDGHKIRQGTISVKEKRVFTDIYGDGKAASKGIPLFVFNYLDYNLWALYDAKMRGRGYKEGSSERKIFFESLGCGDLGLNIFDQFYFSRTRRSLEHYYPQAMATGENGTLSQSQINCLGNYAMIGSEANSSGSNWSPKTKLDHYLDSSGKISQISVASLKFVIMMQICKEKEKWEFDEILNHQETMLKVLL